MKITQSLISGFKKFLVFEEKSAATQEKYIRDITAFQQWLQGGTVDKDVAVKYKHFLMEKFAPNSVNSILSSMNCFFIFCKRYDLRLKTLKIQKQIFASDNKELTKAEYERLLAAAKNKNNERLWLLMQTVCSTGIRISELKYITVESVSSGVATISCKGKTRQVFLPKQLCINLSKYTKNKKIMKGSVFVSKNGRPLDRSNIWADMKKLCMLAGVKESKVFPHNLRHLFARTYYSVQKDIVRLADLLGHSSVNTTRIYTMETGEVHRRQIQKLGLLKC